MTTQEKLEYFKTQPGRGLHYMSSPLKAGTLKNTVIGDSCIGYEFVIDTLTYRGCWLSTIEDLELTVDGEKIPRGDMLFRVKGLNIPIANLSSHTEVFWGVEDQAVLSVFKIGGLAKGDHKFRITVKKRNDFGHSVGDGEQGYEQGIEFHNPSAINDEIVFTIA